MNLTKKQGIFYSFILLVVTATSANSKNQNFTDIIEQNIGVNIYQKKNITDKLEGPNLLGPLKAKHPKYEWEFTKPQGQLNEKRKVQEYFFQEHPELLEKASQNLPKKISIHQWMD